MRRVLVRTLGAMVAGGVVVWLVVWYASVHQHLPEEWPRVYVASECPASEFAMALVRLD
jgi:formate-dependent nitrite reductase membrane component NrfD